MVAKASRPRDWIILISKIVDAYLDSIGRIIRDFFCASAGDRQPGLRFGERNAAMGSKVELRELRS